MRNMYRWWLQQYSWDSPSMNLDLEFQFFIGIICTCLIGATICSLKSFPKSQNKIKLVLSYQHWSLQNKVSQNVRQKFQRHGYQVCPIFRSLGKHMACICMHPTRLYLYPNNADLCVCILFSWFLFVIFFSWDAVGILEGLWSFIGLPLSGHESCSQAHYWQKPKVLVL